MDVGFPVSVETTSKETTYRVKLHCPEEPVSEPCHSPTDLCLVRVAGSKGISIGSETSLIPTKHHSAKGSFV